MRITKTVLKNFNDILKVLIGLLAGILVALIFLIASSWFHDQLDLATNFREPPKELILSDYIEFQACELVESP